MTICFASVGFSSRNSASFWFTVCSTSPRTQGFPSLVFVWPSNWGSRSLTERTAASPSRTSSPSRFSSFSFRSPFSRAYLFSVPVNAALKPERWAPPSVVLMLFAKEKTDSTYEPFHCIATSTLPFSISPSKKTIRLWIGSLALFTYSTKSLIPPS